MVDGDGVVEGLGVAGKDADEAARFGGGLEDELLEEEGVHVGGARAGEKDGVGGHFLEGEAVDFTVSFGGSLEVRPFFGESGRVEDDEVVREGLGAEVVEDIGLENGVARGIWGMTSGECAGIVGDVDGGGVRGASFEGCEGKAAGIGKAVEHGPSLGKLEDLFSHFTLIEKEAGFLAKQRLYDVGDAVLFDGHLRGIRAVEELFRIW